MVNILGNAGLAWGWTLINGENVAWGACPQCACSTTTARCTPSKGADLQWEMFDVVQAKFDQRRDTTSCSYSKTLCGVIASIERNDAEKRWCTTFKHVPLTILLTLLAWFGHNALRAQQYEVLSIFIVVGECCDTMICSTTLFSPPPSCLNSTQL